MRYSAQIERDAMQRSLKTSHGHITNIVLPWRPDSIQLWRRQFRVPCNVRSRCAWAGLACALAVLVTAFNIASRAINDVVFEPGDVLFAVAWRTGLVRHSEGMHHLLTLLGSLATWWVLFVACFAALAQFRGAASR